jgi:hypothetical protein
VITQFENDVLKATLAGDSSFVEKRFLATISAEPGPGVCRVGCRW